MARGHVDISERRLRPIYDALDNGNNKKALQEADKALKKQKDLLCAKALRGLALLRLGRMEECLVQVGEVHTNSPTDEPTLQAMSISYREMHKLDRIADLYENANKAQPENEELLSSLFMAYVRIHNYKKQQQTAMKLHKLQPQKNPYYFWAVMSIVMQAQEDPKLAKTMYLPLAERMTEKYAKEERIEAEAEVYLYLMVLEFLGKYDKAWELITGSLGKKLQSELDFKELKEEEMLLKLERWSDANRVIKTLLRTNPDQWQYYKDYFSTLFHLIDSSYTPTPKDDSKDGSSTQNESETGADSKTKSETGKTLVNGDCDGSKEGESESKSDKGVETPEECVDYTVDMASAFILRQLELVKSERRPMRGAYLAQLEIYRCLVERNKGETVSGTGNAMEALEQYYTLFGDKPCCFSDLKPYLPLLGKDQEKFVKKHLEESFPSKTDGELSLPDNSKSLQRHINLVALSRLAEVHSRWSLEQRLELVKELSDRYQHGLQFGAELLKTEPKFADTYILIAAHTLYDIWVESGDQQYMWRALVLLEKCLVRSPTNFDVKLLLIKMYCLLGAFGPCPHLYDGMEIKHVQNDSLGYIVTNHIARLGHVSSCCSLYDTMLRFFSINHKETTEYLVQSYKFGSFTKIIEFVKFREKLKNSFQYAAAKTERMLIDLTMESTVTKHENTEQMVAYLDVNPEQLEICEFDQMVDNRDLMVTANWDPPPTAFTDKWGEYSFKEEKAWLRVRNLLMRTLCQAVIAGQVTARESQQHNNNNAIGNGQQEAASAVKQVFENLKQELRERLNEGKVYTTQPQYPLAGPYRTRLGNYLSQGIGDMYMQICDIFSCVHTMVDTKEEKSDKTFEETLQSLKDKYTASVTESDQVVYCEEEGKKIFHVEVLERLVLLTEFTSHASVFVGSCHRMVKPLKTVHTKKGKKKKGQTQEPVSSVQEPVAVFEYYKGFLTCVEDQSRCLLQLFKALDEKLEGVLNREKGEDTQHGDTKDEAGEDQNILEDVEKQVVLSYRSSAQEMSALLQNKLQYLSTLKL